MAWARDFPAMLNRWRSSSSVMVWAFSALAALHLSFLDRHPFMEVQPDHPLLLVLAEVAAETNLPIDLHVEAVVQGDTPVSSESGGSNPPTVAENITAFERLLSHDDNANIVWAHVGWDNTGAMTLNLLRRLLSAHANLYMSLRLTDNPGVQFPENRPVDGTGTIREGWLQLLTDFPDRFVLGADEFYGIEGKTPERSPSTAATWALLDQLPAALAQKIACDNVRAVYRNE